MAIFSLYNRILTDKLLKETTWSFLTKGVSFILFFGLNIYLARILGPETFGYWSFFFSVITVFLFLSYFGINASSQKYAAQYNKTNELKVVLSSSFRLRMMMSFIFSLLLLLLHQPLANLLGRPDLGYLFLYAAPLVFFAGFVEYLKNVFEGLHRIKYNFFINILEYGLKLCFVVIFFHFSVSLILVVNAFALALLISSIVGFYLLYTRFYRNLNRYIQKVDYKDFTVNIFKYSLPLLVLTIGFLITTEIDTIMIGLLSTDIEVGIYSVAKQIIIKIPHISLALAMGTMPIFAKLNDSNLKELRNLFYKLLKINLYILLPLVLFILVFSKFLINLFYGVEYSAAVLPLQILTIYMLCSSISISLNQFLNYRGVATKRAINMAIMIILNIILNLLLIPQYGALGAAIGTSIAFIPYLVLNWFEIRKILH